MLKILIVDDELLIRKWLCLLIQQNDAYQTELFQVENGEQALEVLEKQEIHLLITDIKMPVMDGMELITQVKEQYPATRIVVLSAYDNYNYVRASLKKGILDYLLKADMDLSDINHILHTVEQDMILEHTIEGNDQEILLEDCLPQAELFRRFWEDTSLTARDYLKKSNPQMSGERLFLTMISINGNGKITLPHSKILVICSNILKGKNIRNVVIPFYNDYFTILYESVYDIYEEQKEENGLLMTYIDEALKRYVSCRLEYAVHNKLIYIEDLRDKIRMEEQLLMIKQFYQKKEIRQLSNHTKEENEKFIEGYKKKVHDALCDHRWEKIAEYKEAYLKQCMEYSLDASTVIQGCVGILYQIYHYVTITTRMKSPISVEDAVIKLLHAATMEHLSLVFETCSQMLLADISEKQKKFSPAIEKSILYLEEHCTEKISLEQVGNYVFLNKNYFSELFKKEVGMNYNDYLNEARIRKACDYIASNRYSISQVAQMAGFSDQNYFAKIFKKMIGQTPMNYKKNLFSNMP